MSYTNVGDKLRNYLLADTTLKAYNHWVEFRLGDNDGNTRNCQYLIEIDIPDGVFITPANTPVSGSDNTVITPADPLAIPPTPEIRTTTTEAEKDFETYKYVFTLRSLRRGYPEKVEAVGNGTQKTVFKLCDDTRNAIDTFFRTCSASPYSLTLCGCSYSNIEYRKLDAEGGLVIMFILLIQEEVSLEAR